MPGWSACPRAAYLLRERAGARLGRGCDGLAAGRRLSLAGGAREPSRAVVRRKTGVCRSASRCGARFEGSASWCRWSRDSPRRVDSLEMIARTEMEALASGDGLPLSVEREHLRGRWRAGSVSSLWVCAWGAALIGRRRGWEFPRRWRPWSDCPERDGGIARWAAARSCRWTKEPSRPVARMSLSAADAEAYCGGDILGCRRGVPASGGGPGGPPPVRGRRGAFVPVSVRLTGQGARGKQGA